MARKPEEKYKHGELTRTKNNLGKISSAEAKRMSKILGGEIGIEQTDSDIADRYQELHNKNKKNSGNKWIVQTGDSISSALKKTPATIIKYGYFDRLKLYYLASHPDHSIKTTKEIIKALFDLQSKQKNYINPNLIDSSNYFFNKSIKNLVKSSRFISKNIQKKYVRRLENPFYWLIIDTICSWEIESIQEEIFKLKINSPDITLESCTSLIKLIYSPLIKLSRLNRKKDIEGAIQYLYKLSIDGLFKKDLQLDRLRKSYTLAVSEIDNVFVTIKYRLYPLLLMFVSSNAYDYNTMFKLKGKEILSFLELNIEDIITFFDRELSKEVSKETKEEETSEDIVDPKIKIEDIRIQQGLLFLDKMFPEAGWNHLQENPDMYPYFQAILNIPKEISLISEKDPLQKIVILIAILKDMFYGFSNIEYGFLVNDIGKPIELTDKMDLLIKNWYLFNDELILKHYLNLLNEYCRHLERSTNMSETNYTKRIASDILWMKKTYISPDMPIDLPKIMQPRTKIAIPKLYETVEELRTILGRMVLEIYSQGEIAVETIRNPEEESWFEIENHVSKRLNSLLKEDNKKLTNRILILYAYEIVEVLNNIIYSTNQGMDANGISGLFRSEDSRGFKPIYSVNSENTFFRLKDKNKKIFINPNDKVQSTDLITGFFGNEQFNLYLQHFISDYEISESVFSLIYINIMGFKTESSDVLKKLLKKIKISVLNSIRFPRDIPFRTEQDKIYILLPKADINEALITAKRLAVDKNSKNKLYIGVTQYQQNIEEKELLTILENTISKQLPVPGITYYDVNKKSYIQQPS